MRIAYTRSYRPEWIGNVGHDLYVYRWRYKVWRAPPNRYPMLEQPNDCEWIVPGTELGEDLDSRNWKVVI